ncbi:carbohydrate kinase family protein [Nocardioides sp. Kera G14]|uniref:carbohydrate kinase family protein n=1 Tax=Nocardioides sp. Kera G14 TaxID=2884264 RepID=UPI001D10FB0C|nr:carbohydrate kinase [Nocardioides sp. Kera G14]UDY23323.1 carbohydrate kinase [Nocardioides sp. Kera G14]
MSALVIGEALVDLIRRAGEPDDARVGGSPLNVAVGLARLGVEATLVAPVGGDDHGRLVRDHLAENGVELVGASSDVRTSTAVATIQPDGSALYDFDIAWSTPLLPAGGAATLVHTGSVAAVLGARELLPLLTGLREDAIVSYDPNVRPQLLGPVGDAGPVIEAFVASADVVKASTEDLEWLHPGRPLGEVAEEWLALGPAIVAVTDGGRGAFAMCGAGRVDVPAVEAEVVDTIGAGDSFMAGLLAALSGVNREELQRIDRVGLERALGFAARCAAVTVSRPGADPPYRGEP